MSAAGSHADPERRGREAARLHATIAPRLFADLEQAGLLPDAGRERARREWECFALYACVRGLIAGGGFNRETAAAIDALHEAALSAPAAEAGGESEAERRARVAARYSEYGEIGRAGGSSGAATVTARLGAAAARHMTGAAEPDPELREMVGVLHETLVEGIAAACGTGS